MIWIFWDFIPSFHKFPVSTKTSPRNVGPESSYLHQLKTIFVRPQPQRLWRTHVERRLRSPAAPGWPRNRQVVIQKTGKNGDFMGFNWDVSWDFMGLKWWCLMGCLMGLAWDLVGDAQIKESSFGVFGCGFGSSRWVSQPEFAPDCGNHVSWWDGKLWMTPPICHQSAGAFWENWEKLWSYQLWPKLGLNRQSGRVFLVFDIDNQLGEVL